MAVSGRNPCHIPESVPVAFHPGKKHRTWKADLTSHRCFLKHWYPPDWYCFPDGRAEDQEESGENEEEDRSAGSGESVEHLPDRPTDAHMRQHQHTSSRLLLLFPLATSVLPDVRRLPGHRPPLPRATLPGALLLVRERTEKVVAWHVRRPDWHGAFGVRSFLFRSNTLLLEHQPLCALPPLWPGCVPYAFLAPSLPLQ